LEEFQRLPSYKLYLAIGEDTYHSGFQRKVVQFIVEVDKIPLIVINLDEAEVMEWIN